MSEHVPKSFHDARTSASIRAVCVLSIVLVVAQCASSKQRAEMTPSHTDQPPAVPEAHVLFLRGSIGTNTLDLDPAFVLEMRPSLPGAGDSRHRLSGLDAQGDTLFQFRFDGVEVADGESGLIHFSFAVPVEARTIEQLHSIALTAADGRSMVLSATGSAPELAHALDSGAVAVAERIVDGRVKLTWDAQRFPQIIARDDAGTMLGIGRGGEAFVRSERSTLEVLVSDGVRSGSVSVVVQRD